MAFSYTHSIMPMSDLRQNPKKVKRQLKKSPVVITTDGRPDFGVCDLQTLSIANHVKQIRDSLLSRSKTPEKAFMDLDDVFAELTKKHGV